MTQTNLADALGTSYQQVQKYEIGLNRVAAGRLWDLASILEVDVTYFFEGIQKRDTRKAKSRKSRTAAKAARRNGRSAGR